MTLVLEFSLPASAFALDETLETVPDAELELGRVVPTGQKRFPFLWVKGTNREQFQRQASQSNEIDEMTLVEGWSSRRLYEIAWSGRVETMIQGIVDGNGAVLSGRATNREWQFKLRFPDRTHARLFQRHCVETEIPIDLSKLYDLSEQGVQMEYGLTAKQWKALRLAYERGYFREPREVNLTDLGSELDISARAVSYRLRRGISCLVENTVSTGLESLEDGE